MKSREIAVSACSVLLGAFLGVGSILYAAEEVALSAIDPNAVRSGQYRTATPEDIDVSAFSKRSIAEQRRAARSSTNVDVTAPVRHRAAPVMEEVNGDNPVCMQIEDILSALRAQVLWLVGDNFENVELRSGIAAAFDASIEAHGCMPIEESTVPTGERAAAPLVRVRVNNNCENLSPRRGAQCRAYEKAGIRWEPSQGIDR